MKAENISDELKYVNQIGMTLSTEERMNLEIVLMKLQEKEPADEIRFWGKVEGTNKNYYIAVVHNLRNQHGFPLKKFYYTNTEFNNFSSLPGVKSQFLQEVQNYRQFFTGEHDRILFSQGNDCFTELDRLTYLVHSVEKDCQTVPLGAYKLTPSKELRINENFTGISVADCKDLNKYLHFRDPLDQERKAIQCKIIISVRDDAVFRSDFLESLHSDKQQGQWSIQSDSSKLNITIRSLLWPGYVAYHHLNSKVFGGVYIGNGVKNSDLEFILS